jgi:hypothetical protein
MANRTARPFGLAVVRHQQALNLPANELLDGAIGSTVPIPASSTIFEHVSSSRLGLSSTSCLFAHNNCHQSFLLSNNGSG